MDIPAISCPSCNANVESANHVFFECDIATDMWKPFCRLGGVFLFFKLLSMGFFSMDWIILGMLLKRKTRLVFMAFSSVLGMRDSSFIPFSRDLLGFHQNHLSRKGKPVARPREWGFSFAEVKIGPSPSCQRFFIPFDSSQGDTRSKIDRLDVRDAHIDARDD
ncbi:hypothetical protein Tco_0978139 [Tanacetum coccineum]|uniref:Reverse transcriptase zinc-binding domain-containing protein n=1 Tax=Tanacetum coccineum TaxID=301880 RepID=A0ABQ5EMI8_9ASTR